MKLSKGLKAKFEKQNINAIEKVAESFYVSSSVNRQRFIEVLFYLECTKRFRENRAFKDATFKRYLMDKFNTRYITYWNERYAFLQFKEVSSNPNIGPGVVIKAKHFCGEEHHKAIKEISDIPEGKINRILIDKIINKFRKPVIQKPVVDLDEAKRTKEKILNDLNESIKDTEEKDKQIERLKATVLSLKAENLKLAKEAEHYRNEYARLIAHFTDAEELQAEVV